MSRRSERPATPDVAEVATVRIGRPPPPRSPAVRGRIAAGERDMPAVWRVPEETPVAILVNGESFAVMMATPADLEDFGLGFALTEGIVARADQIEGLRIADAADGLLLNIRVAPRLADGAAPRRRSIPGRSGCGICGAQTIGAALPRLPRVGGRVPSPAALRVAFAALPGAQSMHAENRSTHAAAFCDAAGAIRLLREDVGRHNALDKLGGALGRAGLRARDGFILLSSRISVEMVQKAAVLGTPFLAAVSGPSALALRQAAAAGMRIGCLAGDGIMIFDTAARTEGPA